MAVPRPLDEQYADSYSQRAAIQPSAGRIKNVRTTPSKQQNPNQRRGGDAAKVAGSAVRVTGVTMQAAGKGTKAVGSGMTRAGAALSTTGIGAVVGVPLAAAGAATRTTGAAMDTAGKATRRAGKKVSKTGKKIKLAKNLKQHGRASRVSISVISWGIPLYFVFQLPFAIMHLITFGLANAFYEAIEVFEPDENDGWFSSIIKGTVDVISSVVGDALSSLNKLVTDLTGFDLGSVLEAINPVNFFGLMTAVMFVYGFALLLTIGFLFTMARVNPFFGQGATVKISVVILCLFGYMFPFFNLFPWFIFWTLAVWRYPN